MGKSSKKNEKLLKTPYGLHNQGATCYLNSVLQLLFMTPDFHQRLKTNLKTDKVLKTFFENLKKESCETKDITKHFQIEDVHKQCDAAEYLELILNRTGRPASEIFRGVLSYSTKCSQEHIINKETNAFWTLPLPLKDQNNGNFSVERGLERIFMKKTFRGHNKVFCEDCGTETKAERRCEMTVAPRVLVLLLKRFVFDLSTRSHAKSNCTVEIPSTLQIKEKSYDLYGIVHHWGSLRSGHYTATIQSNDDKTWYEFNDDSVQKVEEKPTNPYGSDTAYLLAYREVRKQTYPSISQKEQKKIGNKVDCVNEETNNVTNKDHTAIQMQRDTDEHNSKKTCTSQQRNIALIVCGVTLVVLILVLGLSLGLTRK